MVRMLTARLQPLGTVARALGVPSSWLRGEADARRLPCIRAGRTIIFDVPTVERLLLERAQRSGPGEVQTR